MSSVQSFSVDYTHPECAGVTAIRVLAVVMVAIEHHRSKKPTPSWAACLRLAEQVVQEEEKRIR